MSRPICLFFCILLTSIYILQYRIKAGSFGCYRVWVRFLMNNINGQTQKHFNKVENPIHKKAHLVQVALEAADDCNWLQIQKARIE